MHPAELPISKIQKALGSDNPISTIWVQNPSDNTSPRGKNIVRITFMSRKFVDAAGEGYNVAEAAEDLIEKINEELRPQCKCGCLKTQCE